MGAISARASGIKTVPTAASLPASGFEGQKYIAEDTGVEYTWHSGAWGITGGATAVTGPASATDNAVARFDTATGKVIQNSVHLLDDNGAVVNTGTDGTFQTQDKTGATNSVAVSIESGATVDGDSGDVSLIAGTPSGTGTQGDAKVTGKNIVLTLEGPDDIFSILSALNTFIQMSENSAGSLCAISLNATAANDTALLVVDGGTATSAAIVKLTADGNDGADLRFTGGTTIDLTTADDIDLELMSGDTSAAATDSGDVTLGSGDVAGAGSNSGNVTVKTGTAAGTRGDLLLDALNVLLTAAGVLTVANIKLTVDTTDVSNPPTDAELDAIFGTPATVGAGFTAYIDDNAGGANFYQVTSDGTNWWIFTGTKAV